MAGVLSITASIIAVLQAAESLGFLLKKVKTYRAASDEVLALINEISDIRLILNEHNDIAKQLNHIREEPRARLQRSLDDTKNKILQIEGLIQGKLIKLHDRSDPEINKFSWLRKKSEVDRMRRELKELRQTIADHFAVINLNLQSRIGIRIDQITVDNTALRNRQQKSDLRTTDQFSRVFDSQQKIIQRVDEAEISVLNLFEAGNQETRAAQLQIRERLEDTEGMVLNMLHSQLTMENTQRMMHDLILEMSSVIVPNGSHQSRLRITASNISSHKCNPKCICCCHDQRSFQTGVLTGLLGKLFVGYSGLPVMAQRCNYQGCSRRISTVKVIYAFPRWFLTRAVFMSFTGGLVPKASLKVLSYFPNTAATTAFVRSAKSGDIRQIQGLLAKGLMSPESMTRQWIPLTYALSYGYMEVCELLLIAGADPSMPDPSSQMSGLDWARKIEFSASVNSFSDVTIRKVLQLFPKSENEFAPIPTLHRIVLGMSKQPLTDYLVKYNGPLDYATKLWGYTALDWAVMRNDHNALRTMLEYETDENTRKSLAESLMFRVNCAPCLEVLLATGPNINVASSKGINILSHALNDRMPLGPKNYITQLLNSTPDPNTYDTTFETTPLMLSSLGDQVDLAALLIRHGADVNFMSSRHKKPAWGFAIWLNAHKCLQLFIRHGINLSTKFGSERWTVLHYAALSANTKTMEILADANIRVVDVDDKAFDGKTAREILKNRRDYSPELNDAFEALVFSIQPRIGEDVEDQEAKEDHERWETKEPQDFQDTQDARDTRADPEPWETEELHDFQGIQEIQEVQKPTHSITTTKEMHADVAGSKEILEQIEAAAKRPPTVEDLEDLKDDPEGHPSATENDEMEDEREIFEDAVAYL